MTNSISCLGALGATLLLGAALFAEPGPLGIEMVAIPAGTFRMGSDAGNWDEMPVRNVTITRPFLISKTEVTRLQFLQFRRDHPSGAGRKAISVSWSDAVAFCEWLSEKEGKPYRLPTEAEWEYACRLQGADGEGKLVGMLDDVVEWCLDWHGEYPADDQVDPVGPDSGLVRVLRGNKLDVSDRTLVPWGYGRPAYRAGMPEAFGLPYYRANVSFRIVQAPPPEGRPHPAELKLFSLGVKQSTAAIAGRFAPDVRRPYFRKRYLLPSPPETWEGNHYERPDFLRSMQALALHPGFGGHQHSPALEVLPNGDLLFVAYTSWTEYNPEVGLIASRLRLGHDEWEMPSYGFDLVGANDHAPLLWTEDGRTHLFWGNPKLPPPGPPFQWITTLDSGATWGPVQYPRFVTPVGPNSIQPINSAIRDRDGIIYIAGDGLRAESSILWTSDDDMRTWQDPMGRTNGGHSTFALLSDGKTLFALNGRKTHIDYYMTSSTSRDGAKTFVTGKTPFAWGGSNQRPSLLRLASGRLLAAADYLHSTDRSPDELKDKSGSFLAVSDDDGRTWRFKDLAGGQLHETRKSRGFGTIGYSVLRQGQDGMIHLITTMNEPCLHFTFNEAWVLSGEEMDSSDAALMANSTNSVADVSVHEERDANGRLRLSWSAGRGDDGRYVLHGPERWCYPDGTPQYEATFALGKKTGRETLYDSAGRKAWTWDHNPDGHSRWTQFWPNQTTKAESTWKHFHADGPAKRWDSNGRILSEASFSDGKEQP